MRIDAAAMDVVRRTRRRHGICFEAVRQAQSSSAIAASARIVERTSALKGAERSSGNLAHRRELTSRRDVPEADGRERQPWDISWDTSIVTLRDIA